MHRLLTHSSSPTVWLEECAQAVFYSHLHNRGYPSKAIDSMFRTVNWNQRSKMLELKKRVADDKFFAQYRGCVFSNRNAPGSVELRMETDLSLEELREQGQGRDIFRCTGPTEAAAPPDTGAAARPPQAAREACQRWMRSCPGPQRRRRQRGRRRRARRPPRHRGRADVGPAWPLAASAAAGAPATSSFPAP
jgi:hypothetical protein